MSKVILLGPEGNLGSAIYKKIQETKELDVIPLSHKDYDITDRIQTEKIVKTLKPECIINTVAYNALDRCEANKKEYLKALELNSTVVRHLGAVALDNNSRLVHYSTECVFAGDGEYQEKSATSPVNKYGLTKQEGEKHLIELGAMGLKYYIIRLPRLFGTAGKSPNSKPSFFDVILNASKDKKHIEVVCDEFSNFTYTTDAANSLVDLLKGDYENGIYHTVNEGVFSWYEATDVFFKMINNRTKIVPIEGNQLNRSAPRPKNMNLLNTKQNNQPNFYDALIRFVNSSSY
jgi:dTDP-4-dehydrorhamnose reductase